MTRARIATIAALALLAAAPFLLSEFHVALMNYIGLASIVTLGLVLLTGVGGLTSFGQAAFVGDHVREMDQRQVWIVLKALLHYCGRGTETSRGPSLPKGVLESMQTGAVTPDLHDHFS